ncbi:hypothetical protein COU20_00675 [Candidatus Kaiserbacteria bacterium CG10_big_fil_rev_8_21_14_0_10_59_10]|uniref:Transglycosylase SLT domain-containing protein n=1 Tax=Candidatus Kaiserbacteria bacterium CG10_big_fil_rev_8_21_14_0_10_59_10 TaxID=1974612 RepID=A0A2H0U8P9_9BACT|nr:MAG: hypothetical protein COU20_00675 [Candidatus Kaiserbacteria bacterium CG10_big_fil_rev_8_21_14_0_10_59_10]
MHRETLRVVRMPHAVFVAVVCALFLLVLLHVPSVALAESAEERRLRLERELAAIEADILAKRSDLTVLQGARQSLERDIAILDAEIAAAQLAIRRRDIAISNIRDDIAQKEASIRALDERVAKGAQSLAQLIRKTREIDDMSLVQLILSHGNISQVFADIDSFEQIHNAMDATFSELAEVRADLASRKAALESRHMDEAQLRQFQVLERQNIERQEREKQQILSVTKGQEQEYQKLIAERQQTAAQIRAMLFELADSTDISFGVAYEYAKEASALTGVRPAFLLGVLQTESRLGRNVGQCLLTNDPNKGDGKGANTGRPMPRTMHPNRDVDPFMNIITKELGLDPFNTRVSCWQPWYDNAGNPLGWGGAMGPAQFIPSTWMLFKDRVGRLTGQATPNPWSPRTAFIASAVYLGDLGAGKGGTTAEREASCRYYSGRGCSANTGAQSYASSVQNHAAEFEKQIAVLEGR